MCMPQSHGNQEGPAVIEMTVKLIDEQAQAVLRSEGLSNGYGVRKSMALQQAEDRLLGSIQDAWNAEVQRRTEAQDGDQ